VRRPARQFPRRQPRGHSPLAKCQHAQWRGVPPQSQPTTIANPAAKQQLATVGTAERPVMGQVDGIRPAGVRVALFVRVESVVAPVGSWRAAYSARCARRTLARGAIDLVPPDPNYDHDHECDDMNQGDENY